MWGQQVQLQVQQGRDAAREDWHRVMDAALSLLVQPHRSGVQEQLIVKEEADEEQSPGGDQQDAERLHIKKEEVWSSMEDEELSVKEEMDPTRFPLTVVLMKSEDDEDIPLFSQLHQTEVGDLPTSSSAGQMKAERDGEHSGGAESSRNPDTSSSSETEVSGDEEEEEEEDVNHPGSHLKHPPDFGSETEDSENDWKETRAAESGGNAANKSLSCSECRQQFNKSSLHSKTSKARPAGCLVGKKIVREKKTVESLRNIQAGVKCFTCDDCGKSFNWKNNINVHMRIHSGEKPFGCDVCGRKFSQKSHLNIHTRIHTGEKPFSCDVCEQRFSDKSHLNKHIRVHTGDKPLGCDVCGQHFGDKTSLNRHMRIHTGDKPFGCDSCGQRFSDKSTLKKHIRIHTGEKPFGCFACGKKFSLKGSLKTHMRIHTGEKPFGCDVCGQRFRQLSNLNAHTRIHTGEKPFGCAVCGETFTQTSHFNRHMRIHTGGE
ncbi:zinc finger protein OZF-like [Poeciliopsis prolifica]|uniref:zinc finger protein OZF-like n=1 Tax=Poeciliopsis prolifica TaxID=188132 RepID=UPI002413CD77|nr:zinc finger protein OZF-like [Poeciliopsis prolifica]